MVDIAGRLFPFDRYYPDYLSAVILRLPPFPIRSLDLWPLSTCRAVAWAAISFLA